MTAAARVVLRCPRCGSRMLTRYRVTSCVACGYEDDPEHPVRSAEDYERHEAALREMLALRKPERRRSARHNGERL